MTKKLPTLEQRIVSTMAQRRIAQIHAEEERRARATTENWLPYNLKWLINHPKLLKLYVRALPHRTVVVGVRQQGDFGPSEFVIKKRKELRR